MARELPDAISIDQFRQALEALGLLGCRVESIRANQTEIEVTTFVTDDEGHTRVKGISIVRQIVTYGLRVGADGWEVQHADGR